MTQLESKPGRAAWRSLLEDASDLVCALDASGAIVDANAAWTRVLGWPPEALAGRPLADMIHPDDRAADAPPLAGAADGAARVGRCLMAGGGHRRILWSAVPDGGGVCVVGRDIAPADDHGAQRRDGAETAARLDELLSASLTVVYAFDLKTERYAYLASGFDALAGVPAGAMISGETGWRDLVHPDDRGALMDQIDAWMERGAPGALVTQFRIIRPDGTIRWIEDRARLMRHGDGRADEVVGALADVTEKVEREQETSRSRATLAATVAALPDLLFEVDEDGRFHTVSFGSDAVVTVPAEQMLGRTLDEALPPNVARIGHAAIRAAAERGVSRGHVYPMDAGGQRRWYELAISRKDQPGAGPARFVALVRDITDGHRLSETLERERTLFRTVFENSPALMFLKRRDGRFLTANREFLARWGLDRVEGLTGADFAAPEVMARLERVDAAVFATGVPALGEETVQTPDGQRQFMSARFLAPDPDSGDDLLCYAGIDISEQKRRETEAAAARDQLEAVLENADVAMFLKDRDGRFVYANPVMRRQWGVTTIEGLTTHDLAPPDLADALAAKDARVLETGERTSDEITVVFPDGAERSLVVSRFPVPDARTGGALLCALGTDVTELRRREVEAEENRRLAEEAGRAKAQFLANMSHEIRTPMNGVIGMADLLARTPLDENQGRMIAVIRESGETLLTIINDILDYSKIESGRMTVEAAPFRPTDVAERVRRIMATRAAESGVTIDFDVGPDAARLRIGDTHRIEQILLNLVSNAVKFAERGNVCVSMTGPEGAPLTIAVADDGIGMTEEEASRVFERFAQANDATTRRFGGTGLGLSIVRGLAEAMGGTIRVETRPGDGALFTVTLPLPEARSASQATDGAAAPSVAPGLRVLAADDNEVNRLVLSAMLDTLGVEHRMVEGGLDAVAAARDERFDMLLLDISMPDMDGRDALAAIRSEAVARGAPLAPAVAVTANALPEQVTAFSAAGFDAHLAKPIRLSDLAATMARCAKGGKRRASRA